ncbi:MAG: biotin/lipoyl-binding protein [Anaerolineales bacterium]|nr:biotin/lipoyl-binding protein [Anaerolineales bacterium]
MKYLTTIAGQTFTIEINDDRRVLVDGVEYEVDLARVGDQPVYTLLINGQSHEAFVYAGEEADVWQVLLRGALYSALVEDEREKRLRAASGAGTSAVSGEFNLKAPMPGLIVAVPVVEGQAVEKGDNLIILESMKMQNELKAPRAGTVTRVKVKAGDSVEHHQVLVTVA